MLNLGKYHQESFIAVMVSFCWYTNLVATWGAAFLQSEIDAECTLSPRPKGWLLLQQHLDDGLSCALEKHGIRSLEQWLNRFNVQVCKVGCEQKSYAKLILYIQGFRIRWHTQNDAFMPSKRSSYPSTKTVVHDGILGPPPSVCHHSD